MAKPEEKKRGDLSVTALYTSAVWAWGELPGAELLASDDARRAFDTTNAALSAARLFMPGARSLKHSLLHRHTMIDHLLRASGARRVLELAAGLSRRGVAFTDDPDLRYTELDLAPVVERKRALLERTPEGARSLARPNLRFATGDALEAPLDALVDAMGDSGGPLFVIAEGLLMYLPPDAQRSLWQKAHALLARAGGGTFVFDLVPAVEQPPPGAVGRSLEWLMKRFTDGKSFERDSRTRDDIASELRSLGFPEVDLIEPHAVAAAWGLPHPEVPTQQLLFCCRVG